MSESPFNDLVKPIVSSSGCLDTHIMMRFTCRARNRYKCCQFRSKCQPVSQQVSIGSISINSLPL